jgi:nucleotide-binding universal stress UspA family protein
MLPFKKIVFPVDYSDSCWAAVPYVQGAVKHFSAQLAVVRAFTNTDWLKEVGEEVEQKLHDFVAEAFPSQKVDIFFEEGDPAKAIQKVVQHQEADLVMIPTHGREPVDEFLTGSVTEKVLRDISAAVWTVTPPALKRHPHDVEYKALLCAVDFSNETEAVLRAAKALASSYQANLLLVHVVEDPAAKTDQIEAANKVLAFWKQKVGIDAPHAVVAGMTPGTLRDQAVREKADLIVTGRGQIQGAISRLASDLYPVIREAPCPVLSI